MISKSSIAFLVTLLFFLLEIVVFKGGDSPISFVILYYVIFTSLIVQEKLK